MKLSFPDQAWSPSDPLPEFDAPPVAETSVGIQFDGLEGYTTLTAATYWDRIRSRYPKLEEHPPLDPVFETFGPTNSQPGQVQVQVLQGVIQPRVWFVNNDGDELVQLQKDRLFFNWRRLDSSQPYPRYARVREELKSSLAELEGWAKNAALGEVHPTQCEAIYVNRVPLRNAEGSGCGLSWIFPWFDGLKGTTESGTFQFRRRLHDESQSPVARLHCTLQYGTDAGGEREAQLLLHVRGGPKEATMDGCLDMIDAEREVIVRTFADITSSEAHKMWRRTR